MQRLVRTKKTVGPADPESGPDTQAFIRFHGTSHFWRQALALG
jgi:hypothetical protein